jgi:hypothetical protein
MAEITIRPLFHRQLDAETPRQILNELPRDAT